MKSKFEKPTIENITQFLTDVKNYDFFTAQGFADRFWHYYESKGWKVGKTGMKDWKAAVRTWELNTKKYEADRGFNGTGGQKLGTSAARIEALKRW